VCRSECIKAQLLSRYSPHGYLAFVNGDDPHFKPQAQTWARVSPNQETRALFDEEEGKVSLPRVTFPPNLVWKNREQRCKMGAKKATPLPSLPLPLFVMTFHVYCVLP